LIEKTILANLTTLSRPPLPRAYDHMRVVCIGSASTKSTKTLLKFSHSIIRAANVYFPTPPLSLVIRAVQSKAAAK